MRQKVIYFLQVPENLELRQIFQSPESENVEVFEMEGWSHQMAQVLQ